MEQNTELHAYFDKKIFDLSGRLGGRARKFASSRQTYQATFSLGIATAQCAIGITQLKLI